MSEALQIVARVLLGLLLVWTAGAKVRAFADFKRTVAKLGISERRSSAVASSVIGCEALAPVFLAASSLIAATYIVVMSLLFTLSAVRALLLHEPIECNCFGVGSSLRASFLGLKQIALLPIWLGLAALIGLIGRMPTVLNMLLANATALSLLALTTATGSRGATSEAKADRFAFNEGYSF